MSLDSSLSGDVVNSVDLGCFDLHNTGRHYTLLAHCPVCGSNEPADLVCLGNTIELTGMDCGHRWYRDTPVGAKEGSD